jgi:cytoskeletal protein CcmA (bactofilin family)
MYQIITAGNRALKTWNKETDKPANLILTGFTIKYDFYVFQSVQVQGQVQGP